MTNLGQLYRAGGLEAVKAELALRYSGWIAEIKAAPDAAPADLLGKALVGAICAGDQGNAARLAQRLVPDAPALTPLRLSPLATLSAYCAARGLRCEEALAPTQVKLAASSSYSLPHTYDTGPAVFASIPGAQYIPGWDTVIGEDGTILSDTGYMPLEVATRAFATFRVQAVDSLVHFSPAEERYFDGEVLFLSAPDHSVGHWMVDFLPRLRGLEILAGRKVRLAVPTDLEPRYAEMLLAFGFRDEDILRCVPGVRHRFRLCHVYKAGGSEPPNPVHVKFVRGGLMRGESRQLNPAKRVFLARTSVGTRRISNQVELDELLAERGFITADPADLDLAAQKALLGDAAVILGPFGSNLFGMYLAPQGCTVMVLMNAALEDPIFAPTTALLGMTHQFVLCAAAPGNGGKRPKDRDVVVNCDALAQQLAAAGA